jgi:hypothetical protein
MVLFLNRSVLSALVAVAVCAGTPAMAQHHNQHDGRALKEDPRLAVASTRLDPDCATAYGADLLTLLTGDVHRSTTGETR